MLTVRAMSRFEKQTGFQQTLDDWLLNDILDFCTYGLALVSYLQNVFVWSNVNTHFIWLKHAFNYREIWQETETV